MAEDVQGLAAIRQRVEQLIADRRCDAGTIAAFRELLEALTTETARREQFQAAERELSDAYLRVRRLLNAYDTRPGGVDRFDVTEQAIRDLQAECRRLTGERDRLASALRDLSQRWRERTVETIRTYTEGFIRGRRACADELDALLPRAEDGQET